MSCLEHHTTDNLANAWVGIHYCTSILSTLWPMQAFRSLKLIRHCILLGWIPADSLLLWNCTLFSSQLQRQLVQVIQACVTNELFSSIHKGFLGPVKQMQEATQELEGTSMAGEKTMGEQWGSGCAPQCRCNCSSPCCFHCSSALSWSPANPTKSWDHISITTFDPHEFVRPPPLFSQSPLPLFPATVCRKSRR